MIRLDIYYPDSIPIIGYSLRSIIIRLLPPSNTAYAVRLTDGESHCLAS